MRIRQLRFENLNSLTGLWEIDFTAPPYLQNGIFAITGPTGAGKTTLFDAICLALYGRTPRLNVISQSTNEIMSRQSGYCFAEVTFETRQGTFVCHWSQRRARKQADGKLQAPKHEISDGITHKPLETKLKQVALTIEKKTGMDFDRFTRSMLLAQGDFSAFLSASPDQRGPILEQITGTEIYSTISTKVYERYKREQQTLTKATEDLQGIELLSSEHEQQLADTIDRQSHQADVLTQKHNQANRALAWINNVTHLKTQLEEEKGKWHVFENNRETYDSLKQKYHQATRAAALGDKFERVISNRKHQSENQKDLDQGRLCLREYELSARNAKQALLTAQQAHQTGLETTRQETQLINQVREIDFSIGEKKKVVATAQQNLAALEAEYQDALLQQKSIQNQSETLKKQLLSLTEYRKINTADEQLVFQFSGISEQLDGLGQLLHKRCKIATQLSQQLPDDKNRTAIASTQKQVTKLNEQLQTERDIYRKIEKDLNAVLNNKTLTQWRESIDRAQTRCTDLKVLTDAIQEGEAVQKSLNELNVKQSQKEAALAQKHTTLKELSTAQNLLDTSVKHLETQVVLQQRIADLEEQRNYLQAGVPCPLCGALEHPFATRDIPQVSVSEQTLATEKQLLQKNIQQQGQLSIEIAQLQTELAQIESLFIEKQETYQKLAAIQSRQTRELNLFETLVTSQHISAEHELVLATIAAEKKIIQAAETQNEALKSCKKNGEQLKETLNTTERHLQSLIYEREMQKQKCQLLKKDLNDLTTQFAIQQKSVLLKLKPWQKNGLPSLPGVLSLKENAKIETHTLDLKALAQTNRIFVFEITKIKEALEKRRDSWEKNNLNKILAEKETGLLAEKKKALSSQVLKLETQKQQVNNQWTEQTTLLTDMLQKRTSLFGEKNVESELQRLEDLMEAKAADLESAQKASNEATGRLAALVLKNESLAVSIQKREQELIAFETDFQRGLEDEGFIDESDYISAVVTVDELKRLGQKVSELNREETTLKTRLADCKSKLAALKNENVTNETAQTLQNRVNDLSTETGALHQELGANRQKLCDNQTRKRQQKDVLAVIAAQEINYKKWHNLQELIGSADGKKFRNFAQGLTFEIMISHANKQLQKMNARYFLMRSETVPLDLNVVDNFQAGQIRSTKNLSGGESFIISLSLALGLSKMASKNVSVDSLFLDEGFGTLDEDALDTALEALSGLKQEGKLIGVISHVAAIKERIGTQLDVAQLPGGRGRISGPGVQQTTRYI